MSRKLLIFLLATLLLVPSAWAADVGIFQTKTGQTCAQRIASPATGQSWCFDLDANALKLWNGTAWVSVVGAQALPAYALASLPAAGTAGRLARVTDDDRGIATDLSDQWWLANRSWGIPVEWFGATGDGTTNDNVALQAALTRGGTILLRKGVTYLNSSANLTMVAGTTLVIPYGTTLNLATRRLIAQDVNNIAIVGGGRILSTNINTTDSVPANWIGLGIVSVGSNTATPATNIRIIGVQIVGDFTGTPAGVTNNRKYGILATNVRGLWILDNHLEDIHSEAIITHQGASTSAPSTDNLGHFIQRNFVRRFGHDGISTNQTVILNTHITHNQLYNGYQGIEGLAGDISDNIVDTMVNAGITTGGNNTNGRPVSFVDNTVRNVTAGPGMNLGFNNSALSGPIKVQGNTVQTVAGNGIVIGGTTPDAVRDLHAVNNTVINAGTTTAGSSSMSIAATRGYVGGNSLLNPGANATRGLSLDNSTDLVIGPNHVHPHVSDTFFNTNAATGIRAVQRVIHGTGGAVTVTGTIDETTMRTLTVKANSLRSTGGYHIVAAGTIAGTAGTKTIRLKFGTSGLTSVAEAAGATNAWRMEAWVINQGNGNVQGVTVLSHEAGAIEEMNAFTTAENTAADLELALTGQLGNAGDTITGVVWIVEPFVALRGAN